METVWLKGILTVLVCIACLSAMILLVKLFIARDVEFRSEKGIHNFHKNGRPPMKAARRHSMTIGILTTRRSHKK